MIIFMIKLRFLGNASLIVQAGESEPTFLLVE